jgi:hypothetical protein
MSDEGSSDLVIGGAEYMARKDALDAAVLTHGPDSLAADVLETAVIYLRWLRQPTRAARRSRRVTMADDPSG